MGGLELLQCFCRPVVRRADRRRYSDTTSGLVLLPSLLLLLLLYLHALALVGTLIQQGTINTFPTMQITRPGAYERR
jgi:hypothetical protein